MKTKRNGFTLIEILVVLGIGGMLMGVLFPFIFNLVTGQQLMRSNLIAVQEIENAARSISKDGMMAETVVEADGESLILEWVNWTENIQESQRSKYYLSGTELKRDHYVSYADETSIPESSKVVARWISGLDFSFSEADRMITAMIASTPGERTEQRKYQVHLRPVGDS